MTALCHGLRPRETRHCEERSDAAVYEYMDCFAALAMTAFHHGLRPRDTRHCEAHSDAAVYAPVTARSAATWQSRTALGQDRGAQGGGATGLALGESTPAFGCLFAMRLP